MNANEEAEAVAVAENGQENIVVVFGCGKIERHN